MRRVKVTLSSRNGLATMTAHDYRLMLAVVRAADRWVSSDDTGDEREKLVAAVDAFNAGGKKK